MDKRRQIDFIVRNGGVCKLIPRTGHCRISHPASSRHVTTSIPERKGKKDAGQDLKSLYKDVMRWTGNRRND
jgi:hypothetical protein